MLNKECKHCIGDMHDDYTSKYPEASHCMYVQKKSGMKKIMIQYVKMM